MIQSSRKIAEKIHKIQKLTQRNSFALEVYQRVNETVQLTPKILLALKRFDQATTDDQRFNEKKSIDQLQKDFDKLRSAVEKTYAKTRLINKPKDYILDQDHHHHLANQSLNFDWQFGPEIRIFEKINSELN